MNTVQESLTGPLPQEGYPPAAKVYQQDELSPTNNGALFAGDKVPPPCFIESGPDRSNHPMNKADNDARQAVDPNRCGFTFSDGRRCRNQRAQLCVHHASREESSRGSVLPELQALCGDLTTATNINRALAHTFLLLAQGRISRKDAVAFGYLAQLLLQTASGVRAEFVAAFGYQPWEAKLKRHLKPRRDEEPEPLDSGKRDPSERAAPPGSISAASSPEKTGATIDQPVQEVSPFPDYRSLVSRSRDLLAGKYDTTPEGRREANNLALELELLKPPASKPPTGVRARVIEHMKRWIAQRSTAHASGSAAHPSPLSKAAVQSESASRPAAEACQPSRKGRQQHAHCAGNEVELSPLNKVNRREESETVRPIGLGVPNEQREREIPPLSPPVNRIELEPSASQASSPYGGSAFPVPKPPARVREKEPTEIGHTTGWFAPASWSGGQPSPFPSRADKFKRRLRSMSSCRLRRLQHLQQQKIY